jgi:hypothetical protein
MRRSRPALACFLLLVGPALLPALSRADFDRVVDFSVTLERLAAVAAGKEPLPVGRMFLLSGTVSDVTIINREEAAFKVRIEVITGEWIGLEDVKSYACYIDFSGPEYFKIFPAKAPRTADPDVVTLNTRILVVGAPVNITTTPLGEKRVLLQGAHIRTIE